LCDRIERRINLYRIDDYIGTQIGTLSDETIKNVQFNPRGPQGLLRLERPVEPPRVSSLRQKLQTALHAKAKAEVVLS
jgi:hypothetical protein